MNKSASKAQEEMRSLRDDNRHLRKYIIAAALWIPVAFVLMVMYSQSPLAEQQFSSGAGDALSPMIFIILVGFPIGAAGLCGGMMVQNRQKIKELSEL